MSQDVADPVVAQSNVVEAQQPSAGELQSAVKQAMEDEFAITDAWKPKRSVRFKIVFQSGQKALVKHLDTMDLLKANLIEEMNFFIKKLMPSKFDEQGAPIEDEAGDGVLGMLADPEKRVRFFALTNRLMEVASIRPKIVNDFVALRTNKNGDKEEIFGWQVKDIEKQIELFGKPVPLLKEGQVYCGGINFTDRMQFFIELNKPLGVIEPFREQATRVDGLVRGEASGNQT